MRNTVEAWNILYLKTTKHLITVSEINISSRILPVTSPTLRTKRSLTIQQNPYPLICNRQAANLIYSSFITGTFLQTFTFLGQVIVLDKLLNYHSLFTLWGGKVNKFNDNCAILSGASKSGIVKKLYWKQVSVGTVVPVVTGKDTKGGQRASSSAMALFLQRSVHKRHLNWAWGKMASVNECHTVSCSPQVGQLIYPLCQTGTQFADSVCVLKFHVPLRVAAVSSVLPEPRQLGPAGGTPLSACVQMWPRVLAHFTPEKSWLSQTSFWSLLRKLS